MTGPADCDRGRRLEAIVERISHIVYMKDTDGRYLFMNSAGEALFERPREEIVGRRDEELFDPDEAEEIREIDVEVIESGEPRTYESRRTVKDEERIFSNEKTPYAPDGEVVGLIGITKDVTEERRRQAALEDLHVATRRLLAATTKEEVAELATETAADVLDLPTNGVYLHNVGQDALVPAAWRDPTDLLAGDRPPQIGPGEGLAWAVFEAGEAQHYDDVREAERVANPDTPFRSEMLLPLGSHGIFLIGTDRIADFDDTDEALARVLAANAETALDRVEGERALRQQNQRLEEVAGIVSHDIRNPLNLAQNYAVSLADTYNDSDLERLMDAHERIDAVIDGVLTWAREGRGLDAVEPVELGPLATASWGAVETGDASLAVEDGLVVEADRDRLRRVLENLFRNAVEHGGGDVRVEIGRLDGAAGFYVADDGPGIPPDERSSVLEMGYSTGPKSTGFGLAICDRIAEAHGWSLAVTESEDGGARFEFVGAPVD